MKNGSPKVDVAQVAAAPPVKATILVVEDEVLIRFMTTEDLRVAGYTVLEAGNAAEALSVLKSSEPVDLVLTDVRMPGSMDGVKLASIVRELWPATKIVILSAYPPQPPAPEIVDGFVSKPYDPRLFVAPLLLQELLSPPAVRGKGPALSPLAPSQARSLGASTPPKALSRSGPLS